jgi:hypothetical protein
MFINSRFLDFEEGLFINKDGGLDEREIRDLRYV